jgi:hypothetical protein
VARKWVDFLGPFPNKKIFTSPFPSNSGAPTAARYSVLSVRRSVLVKNALLDNTPLFSQQVGETAPPHRAT